MERAFTTIVACALLASFLFAGAAGAQEFPKVTVGTTTKADVLDAAGPPAQTRTIEGDDFWYYIVSQRSGLMDLGNILQSYAAGTQGRVHTPQRLPDRLLILRFDGTTGILKSLHQR